jgi:phosphoglycerate dehydrogenase-like enzyme
MTQGEVKPFRVLVLDDYEDQAKEVPAFKELSGRADVTIMKKRLETDEELAHALKGIHALLLVRERTRFGQKQFSLAPDLKLISQTGRTSAHLALAEATRRGIPVAFTPTDSGTSTIELTWALILAVLRQIPLIDRKMREERWAAIPGRLLEGKTLGIIGLGRIGTKVAQIGQAFGTRNLATGKTLTDERARQVGATKVSLEALLRESDIVTVHCPLRPETRGLLGEKETALMKPGAILINTARGPIVSESALIKALEQGHLAGAGLDVYDEEPLPMDHPFRRLHNIVLLPHRGYATVEILHERYELAMTNILSFLDGKPLNLLNPEALNQGKK